VDIVEISRIKNSIEKLGESFLNRVFTDIEKEYCEGKKAARYMSFAARFAAKEAVSKALGTGISGGVGLKDIEVLNDERGKPFIHLHQGANQKFEELLGMNIALSLSHCESYAVASVFIQTKE
jgi:holo-[acyl-carrier protein] synthase